MAETAKSCASCQTARFTLPGNAPSAPHKFLHIPASFPTSHGKLIAGISIVVLIALVSLSHHESSETDSSSVAAPPIPEVGASPSVEEYANAIKAISEDTSDTMEEVLSQCDPTAIPANSRDTCISGVKAAAGKIADDESWLKATSAPKCLAGAKFLLDHALGVYGIALRSYFKLGGYGSMRVVAEQGNDELQRLDDGLTNAIGFCRGRGVD
jgi:hypothetical protein